jgi:diguanylate cyclase (GGDEF)-like protein
VLYSGEPGFFDDDEVRLFREVTSNIGLALELISKQDKLDYLALYDPLTGLPNRTLFRERLTQALEAERRGHSKLALMVFDIERFRSVNDAFGPLAGDRLLQQTAAGLRATAGDISRVAYLGGDVFAIMIPALHDAADIATVLRERAARILEEPFMIEGRELRLKVKAGIALFPEDGADAETLFRNAEAALKRAKQTGERYFFYAPQINARVTERLDLEHALRVAIEQREFVLHFQPKVDLATRRIVGLEALIRWERPGIGLVLPGRADPGARRNRDDPRAGAMGDRRGGGDASRVARARAERPEDRSERIGDSARPIGFHEPRARCARKVRGALRARPRSHGKPVDGGYGRGDPQALRGARARRRRIAR